MVLQPEMRHVVAQTDEEVVMPVMACAKERAGLAHQLRILVHHVGGNIERGFAVGREVEAMRGSDLGRQRHYANMRSRKDR